MTISFRILVSDGARWREAQEKSGLSPSDFFRMKVDLSHALNTGKPSPRRRPREQVAGRVKGDPRVLAQLAAIGNNLNQITKSMHLSAARGNELDVLAVLGALTVLNDSCRAMAERGTKP